MMLNMYVRSEYRGMIGNLTPHDLGSISLGQQRVTKGRVSSCITNVTISEN